MFRIRAFTLLESLLVLFLVSLLTLSLSGSVNRAFEGLETRIFFAHFEQLYRDSQQLSHAQQTPVRLSIDSKKVTNGYQTIALPSRLAPKEPKIIEFSASGGNSSLGKIRFETQDLAVTYQLYLGSGQYKKTVTRLHSP